MKYILRFAEGELRDFFQTNVFNLTNDFKEIGIKKFAIKEKIGEEILNEIHLGFGRIPCTELYSKELSDNHKIKIIMAKIRVAYGNKGKSGALRCIVLVDQKENKCILFHVYAKNKKEEMTPNEYNSIENILNEYLSIFEEENNNG